MVEEWYIPVRPLFPSEAEGGSQKTNTGGGGGGGGGAVGAPRFIVQKEARNVGLSLHVFFVPPGRSTVCLNPVTGVQHQGNQFCGSRTYLSATSVSAAGAHFTRLVKVQSFKNGHVVLEIKYVNLLIL